MQTFLSGIYNSQGTFHKNETLGYKGVKLWAPAIQTLRLWQNPGKASISQGLLATLWAWSKPGDFCCGLVSSARHSFCTPSWSSVTADCFPRGSRLLISSRRGHITRGLHFLSNFWHSRLASSLLFLSLPITKVRVLFLLFPKAAAPKPRHSGITLAMKNYG